MVTRRLARVSDMIGDPLLMNDIQPAEIHPIYDARQALLIQRVNASDGWQTVSPVTPRPGGYQSFDIDCLLSMAAQTGVSFIKLGKAAATDEQDSPNLERQSTPGIAQRFLPEVKQGLLNL